MRIDVKDVSHAYRGRHWVLRHISLRIEPGQSLALMAPSGAGKTTLLSIVGSLTRPTAGVVEWDGSPRLRSVDLARRVGWIFQTVNVLGARTVLDNVAIGLYCRGMSVLAARELAADTLQVVGLEAMLDRRVDSLSGGELQRVAVARALAGSRELVLADEPTAQLDASTTKVVVDAIFRARLPATVLLFATHDPVVAERCDRLVRLHDGQAIES